MNPIVSLMVIMLFVIIALGLVFAIGRPIIDKAEKTAAIRDSESLMKSLWNYLNQVSHEGVDSSRVVSFTSKDGFFEMSSSEDSILFRLEGPELFEYLSRRNSDGIYIISGNDVDCYDNGSFMVMENSRLNASFQLKGYPESWENINTSDNIISLTQKDAGIIIPIANSSVIINSLYSSSYGNGYSELLKTGTKMPFCIAHFHINASSGDEYDIYYTLYSGADFVVQEVFTDQVSKPVTYNFAFHINQTDSIRINDTSILSSSSTDETYTPEKRYISSQANGSVFGVLFAGNYFYNMSLNTDYPGDDYLLQLRQQPRENMALITFTNCTWECVEDRIYEVASERLIGTTFGNFTYSAQDEVWTYLLISSRDINLTRSERWGTGSYDMIIKNLGKEGGRSNIEITMG